MKPLLRNSRAVEIAVPYILVLIALALAVLMIPGFGSGSHLRAISASAAYIGIIAIGQTVTILLGGIDLSVAYMLNLAAVVLTALQAAEWGNGGVFLVILLGAIIGALNGAGIAFLNISPLVMTLGMNSILQGATLLYTNGAPKGYAPDLATTLSTDSIGIPVVVLLWLGLAIVVTVLLKTTTFGRGLYSVGSNRVASMLCALPIKPITITAYAISGASAAVGAVLLVGYSGQAYLGMGDNYLLPSIAIVGDRWHVHLRRAWIVHSDHRRRASDYSRRECAGHRTYRQCGQRDHVRRHHSADDVHQSANGAGQPGSR